MVCTKSNHIDGLAKMGQLKTSTIKVTQNPTTSLDVVRLKSLTSAKRATANELANFSLPHELITQANTTVDTIKHSVITINKEVGQAAEGSLRAKMTKNDGHIALQSIKTAG